MTDVRQMDNESRSNHRGNSSKSISRVKRYFISMDTTRVMVQERNIEADFGSTIYKTKS